MYFVSWGDVLKNSYFGQSTDAYSYIADILISSVLIYEFIIFTAIYSNFGTHVCYPSMPARGIPGIYASRGYFLCARE